MSGKVIIAVEVAEGKTLGAKLIENACNWFVDPRWPYLLLTVYEIIERIIRGECRW